MSRVKVYGTGGMPTRSGTGLWADMVMRRFPDLPFEDDGRLRNPAIRENFISRIFTLKRWRDAMAGGRTPGALVEFHTRHKLLVMAHSVEAYRALGKLVAKAGSEDIDALCQAYFQELSRALALRQTAKKKRQRPCPTPWAISSGTSRPPKRRNWSPSSSSTAKA